MTRFDCGCVPPRESSNPRREDTCNSCLGWLNPAWTSNDKTVGAFLDRLASTLPTRDESWVRFRAHVEARELAGRPIFGQSFLGKNCLWEAKEEAADLALYACLDTLKAIREGRGDEDIELALVAAHHAFKAYDALLRLNAKRHGAP